MTASPIPTVLPTISPEVAAGIGGLFSIGMVSIFLGFVMWVVALIDILKSEFKDPINKVVWIVLTLLLPFLGPILYFLIGRKQVRVGSGISIKSIIATVSFFIYFPLGVILMWFWTKWPKWLKISLTIIGILFAGFGLWGKYISPYK